MAPPAESAIPSHVREGVTTGSLIPISETLAREPWESPESVSPSCGDVGLEVCFGRCLVMADGNQRGHEACDREQAGDLEG
jgi:hypothetical protein